MKDLLRAAAIASAFFVSPPANALDGVYINEPSRLKFVIDGGRLYLRNLNEFSADWKPCCYWYWIDISSDSGKAQYSFLLTAYGSGRPFYLYKDDRNVAGPIGFIGPT